jgi:hypothetical protein
MTTALEENRRRFGATALLCLASLILANIPVRGETPLPGPGEGGFEFVVGEELVYNVRYAFLDLGQVKITTIGRRTADGKECFFARALIDSYRGVPFVDLHAIFESTIDPVMFSRRFVGKTKQDGSWEFSRYRFEYDRKRVIIELGERDTVVNRVDTAEVQTPHQDGLSLFFFARDGVMTGKEMNVPTLIKEKKGNTYLAFNKGRTTAEIDAVEYPVDVVRFDGTMDFIGIFGLTGDFEGWFSNDAARVPIKAKMEVLIGSVTIELMSWKRPGWNPPRAQE